MRAPYISKKRTKKGLHFKHMEPYEYTMLFDGINIGFASRARDLGYAPDDTPEGDMWYAGDGNCMLGPCKTRQEAAMLVVEHLKKTGRIK